MMQSSCIISRFLGRTDSDDKNPRGRGDFYWCSDFGVQLLKILSGEIFLSWYFFEKVNASGGFIGKNNKILLPNPNGGLD